MRKTVIAAAAAALVLVGLVFYLTKVAPTPSRATQTRPAHFANSTPGEGDGATVATADAEASAFAISATSEEPPALVR